MKLTRPEKRQPPETIIALIDVVFFLLVFFMLIGRMDATAPFEVDPPFAQTGADMPAGGATISVAENGDVALDGRMIEWGKLESGLERMLEQDETLRVRVNAHNQAQLRTILPLISAVEKMGVRDVVLVVTPATAGTP